MATATAYVETQMPNLNVWYGSVLSYNASTIIISDGLRQATYTGSFTYSATGSVFGTLNAVSEYRGGVLQYSVTDMNVDANQLYYAVQILGDFEQAATLTLGGADLMTGSSGNDFVRSFSGNDTLHGGDGNDTAYGNEGNDSILGENGNDRLFGDQGSDILNGGIGRDRLKGGSGNDTLSGDDHGDRLDGGGGHDQLRGGAGNDKLNGGAGRDRLYGDTGNDRLDGGSGNDRLVGGHGHDTFVFSTGRDVVRDFNAASSRERVDLRRVESITDFDDLMANHVIRQNGNVIIDDLNGNTMTLTDTTLNSLGADDFIF